MSERPQWDRMLNEPVDPQYVDRISNAVEPELKRHSEHAAELWRATWVRIFKDTWLQMAGLCAAGVAGLALYRRLDQSAAPKNPLAHAILESNHEDGDFDIFETIVFEELEVASDQEMEFIEAWDEREA